MNQCRFARKDGPGSVVSRFYHQHPIHRMDTDDDRKLLALLPQHAPSFVVGR